MSEQLKPCPFCGSPKTEAQHDDGLFWIKCLGCYSTGPATTKYSGAEDNFYRDWNTRTEDAALAAKDARIAELEAYICYADEVSTCAEQLLKMIQIDACDVTKDMVAVLRLDAALKELESFDNTCADGDATATPSEEALDKVEPPIQDRDSLIATGMERLNATHSEDGGEVGQLLVTALRQYQHNDCSGLLAGYDCAEAKRIVSDLIDQHSRIVAAKDAELRELRDSMTFRTSLIGRLEAELERLRAQPARQVGGDEDDYMPTGILEAAMYGDIVDTVEVAKAALAPAAVVMPERKEYPSSAIYPDAKEFASACGEVQGHNSALDKVARLNRRAIPVEFLERCLEQMESDWLQIDGEWGPTKGGLEGAVANGDAEEIRELRALLGKEGE